MRIRLADLEGLHVGVAHSQVWNLILSSSQVKKLVCFSFTESGRRLESSESHGGFHSSWHTLRPKSYLLFIWNQNLIGHPVLLFANSDKSRHRGVFVSWRSKPSILGIPGKVCRDLRNTWGQRHRLGRGLRDCRHLWASAAEEHFSFCSGYMSSWWPSQQRGPSAALTMTPAAQHLLWAWGFQASSLTFGWQFFSFVLLTSLSHPYSFVLSASITHFKLFSHLILFFGLFRGMLISWLDLDRYSYGASSAWTGSWGCPVLSMEGMNKKCLLNMNSVTAGDS